MSSATRLPLRHRTFTRLGPVLATAALSLGGAASYSVSSAPIAPAAPAQAITTGLRLPPPDLRALAQEVCQEEILLRSPRNRAICEALRSNTPLSGIGDPIVRAWAERELADLRTLAANSPVETVTPQLIDGVPIEGAGRITQAVSNGSDRSGAFDYGTVYDSYAIANRPLLSAKEALNLGRHALLPYTGLPCACDVRPADPADPSNPSDLVLIPSGTRRVWGKGVVPALRYAYRARLYALAPQGKGVHRSRSWMAWIDAESGELLQLQPQFAGVTVSAHRFRRDPTTPVMDTQFRIDDPSHSDGLRLSFGKVFHSVDLGGDGDLANGEVDLDPTRPVPFCSPTPEAISTTLCAHSNDSEFRQVNAYAHLYSFWRTVTSAGTIRDFPERPIDVYLDVDDGDESNMTFYDTTPAPGGLEAQDPQVSVLRFSGGKGFRDPTTCPNLPDARLNGALDATILAHEFAHLAVPRLHERRPLDWCGAATCPLPKGRWLFHDFADAYADAYASTDCVSGWSGKNFGGTDQGLACHGYHDEGSGLPRLADRKDRFPEHRTLAKIGSSGYADGQIAAAALWFTRSGLRSRSLAAGSIRYWVLLNRALWGFGFIAPSCSWEKGACDRDIYRYLQDLLVQLVNAAAPLGSSAESRQDGHKILSGFARAGIFLTPVACIDGNPRTGDPRACPMAEGGESGGEALVDIDDNEPGDDPEVDGVRHAEADFLRRDGPAPTFTVWTGPGFRFDDAGEADRIHPSPFSGVRPSPCNESFQVEIATEPTFADPVRSEWLKVPRTGEKVCEGSWTPSPQEWDRLRTQAAGKPAETRLYYRATTRNAVGTGTRRSTEPGGGRFELPPAFALINPTGRP